MTKMLDLITKLSSEVKLAKPLGKPIGWIGCLLLLLVLYAVMVQIFFGVRADILLQLTRPLFLAEIALMLLLFVTSVVAAVLTMYPDLYQKSRLLKLPFIIFFLLLGLFALQFFTAQDLRMIVPEIDLHTMECTRCILLVALIPAAFTFAILQKGATTLPLQAGAFTVLAASALGYLILRFHEASDAISHLLIWHYFPMLFFAMIGAAIGKWLLKW